jgi:Heparinase II/III-like protein/Heparinase II/III N-terminus
MTVFKYYIRRILSLPPHLVIKKAFEKVRHKLLFLYARQRDTRQSTYLKTLPPAFFKLQKYLNPLQVQFLLVNKEQIVVLTNHYLSHCFDLLGSGWVQVKYGMICRGLEGFRYNMSKAVDSDKEGKWLDGRINKTNIDESQKIWRLIDEGYVPIDWHIDFKSGYRWLESTWYQDIRYGHKQGVDIKVPRELARMQHLIQLAWAYALSKDEQRGLEHSVVYVREFRNQVLDFIATNPPRFGVNWECTMDVAIRVANWLVAYDLFRAYGAEFDNDFEAVLIKSIYEHSLHIINNLEWKPEFHGNHYLSNIVGLLFTASYLPRSSETDTWLAFAVQELVNEVGHQFNPDGTNFEASTSYHRFTAEMVTYATALVLGLSQEKQEALKEYDCRLHKMKPLLKHAPVTLYYSSDVDRMIPFPSWYIECLEKMAEFTMHITKPDGHIIQIGDNDSGRLFKMQTAYHWMKADNAIKTYVNLYDYTQMLPNYEYWIEDHCDHRHLVAAINGIFQRQDYFAFTDGVHYESHIIRDLSKGIVFSSRGKRKIPASDNQCQSLSEQVTQYSYLNFGQYIYRSKRLYLAIRCGPNGQNGYGGHAHNDQLSIELSIDSLPIIIDPGTYLYTPLCEKRNLFRSTAMHNTLLVAGKEQNTWYKGTSGLFRMSDQAHAKVIQVSRHKFVGEHHGFCFVHRRTIDVHENLIEGLDECEIRCEKSILYHLAPKVRADLMNENSTITLYADHVRIKVSTNQGKWTVQKAFCSPSYGILQKSQLIRIQSAAESIQWSIEIL